MATRNLTSKFDSIRSQVHGGTKRPRDIESSNGSLLSDGGSSDSAALESGRGLGLGGLEHEMPPEWVDITDTIHTDTNKVKESSQRSHAPSHSTAPRVTSLSQGLAG